MKIKKFLCYVFMFLLTCPAFAQEVDLDRVVVTASRMAKMDYQVASNVTVIREDQIEQSSAYTVSGILQEQLGLNVYDKSTAKTATTDIRGFNDASKMNVLVLVNGRKINSIDISGSDLLQIPLEAVERVEVVRGAGSVLYGDNAVAGVVNIITKEGKGPLSVQLGSYIGSYGRRGSDVELSGSQDNWNYYSYIKYFDDKGYRSNSDVLGKDYDGRLGYRLSDKLKADLFMSWHEDDYGQPGGLNASELDSLGRRGSADDQDFANTKDRHLHLRLDTTPWPEDLDLGHLVFDIGYRNRDTYDVFSAYGYKTKRGIDTYNTNLKYTFDKEIFGHELSFVTGLDYYNVENDILGSGTNTDDLTIDKEEIGTYVFSEFEAFEDFFINAGTRYERADYTFDNRSAASHTKKRADESVSMFGVKYEYGKKSSIFANVQQTFRFLATDEFYNSWNGTVNPNLAPQKGIQYEVGIKHNWADLLTLDVTPYYIKLEDEIFYDPLNGNSNYDKTRRIGVEVEARTDMLKIFPVESLTRWETFLSYTYQDPEFEEGDYDGKRVPLVPNNLAAMGVNIQLFGIYNASLSGRYVGSQYAINDTANATGKVESYFVLDAQLAYEKKNYKVYLQLNNILDEEYFSYVAKPVANSNKDYFPASKRNFIVGVKVKF